MELFWGGSICFISIIVKWRWSGSEWSRNSRGGFKKIFLINMTSFPTSTPTSFSLRKPVFEIKNFVFLSFFSSGFFPYLLSDKDFWISFESKQAVLLLHHLSSHFPKMAMEDWELPPNTYSLIYVPHCKMICYFVSPLTTTHYLSTVGIEIRAKFVGTVGLISLILANATVWLSQCCASKASVHLHFILVQCKLTGSYSRRSITN